MRPQPECPECEKLSKVSEESNKIGNFIDWLQEQHILLANYHDRFDTYYPLMESTESILARYFNIDLDLVEDERRELLKWLQER